MLLVTALELSLTMILEDRELTVSSQMELPLETAQRIMKMEYQ
jgi:hypothetical protein